MRLFPCFVIAFACAALPAQADNAEAVRRPTFARVEDEKGEPLANAVVTFAGCMPHLGITVGPKDVWQVQTDARGRAQAKLQPGLCYVAWAVGPADAAGRAATSRVHGWFGAGSLLTLKCGEVQAPRRLPLSGVEAWQAKAPLRFVAWTSMPGNEIVLTPTAASELVLPMDPVQTIEVQAADGTPLYHVLATTSAVVLPPPQTVRLRAKDEHGAPLALARVRQRVGRLQTWRQDSLGSVANDRWRELGVTDASGLCVIEVPYATNPLQKQSQDSLLLFVGAPGRPSVAGGVFNGALFVNDRKDKVDGDELPFTCKAVEPLAGDLGHVPAGTVVHLAGVCKMFMERTSYMHDARAFAVPVGADGKFVLEDVPAELHSCRLTLVPPEGSSRPLPMFASVLGRELPPELATGRSVLVAEGLADLKVQFLDANNGPARGLVAFLAPAGARGVLLRDSTIRFPLDGRGSAALRLAPGRWVVMAYSDAGTAAQVLELEAGDKNVVLAMKANPVMRVELRDANGKPVVGATVLARGTTTRGTNDPLQSILQNLRDLWVRRWTELRTDAAGRVEIPFVEVEGVTQRLGLLWDGGKTPDLTLEASADWIVVTGQ